MNPTPRITMDEPTRELPGPPVLIADRLRLPGGTELSLTAHPGEVVGLIGAAGTGRTRALLALSGRFVLRGGTLWVDGSSAPRRIRRRVALASAPPAVTVDRHHTLRQLCAETALVERIRLARVREQLIRLGVTADPGGTFGEMSQVEQTLALLGFAAAGDAPVIGIDDLDAGLDATDTTRVWQAARTVAGTDRLVLATANRPDPVTDRIVPMPTGTPEPDRADSAADAPTSEADVTERQQP